MGLSIDEVNREFEGMWEALGFEGGSGMEALLKEFHKLNASDPAKQPGTHEALNSMMEYLKEHGVAKEEVVQRVVVKDRTWMTAWLNAHFKIWKEVLLFLDDPVKRIYDLQRGAAVSGRMPILPKRRRLGALSSPTSDHFNTMVYLREFRGQCNASVKRNIKDPVLRARAQKLVNRKIVSYRQIQTIKDQEFV